MSKVPFLPEFQRWCGKPKVVNGRFMKQPELVSGWGPMDCCGAIFKEGVIKPYPYQNRGVAFSLKGELPKTDLTEADHRIFSRPEFIGKEYRAGTLVEHTAEVDLGFTKLYYNYWKADEDVEYDD